jgi:rhodanese-related sulfurtransferase
VLKLNSLMEDLTQEEWAEQLAQDEKAVVLDVRSDAEVADGIIPNAIHIDIYKGQEFVADIEELDKSKNYYVYCRSGNRSRQACQIMEQLGFENAYNLEGGILDWEGDIVDLE